MKSIRTIKAAMLASLGAVWTLFGYSAAGLPALVNGSLTGPVANGAVPAGWSIIAGSPDTMDLAHNVGVSGVPYYATPSGPSPDGGTWVGFGRDISSAGFTEIFGQSVSGFQVGQSYALSWYEGNFGAQTGPGYSATNRIAVTLNGTLAGSGSLLGLSSAWLSDGFVFTAQNSTIQINFGLTEPGPSYLSIDGITLTAVPEPSYLAFLGLASLGSVRAWRRYAKRR